MPTKKYKKKLNKAQRRMWKTTWLILGISVFLMIFGQHIWGIFGVNILYSEGERSVKVIKISEKGLFWKTWEGEAVLSQDGFATTYIWSFSVDNNDPNKEDLLIQLQNAFETGQTVQIKYIQMAGSIPWRSKTPYFIKEVKFILR